MEAFTSGHFARVPDRLSTAPQLQGRGPLIEAARSVWWYLRKPWQQTTSHKSLYQTATAQPSAMQKTLRCRVQTTKVADEKQ